MIHISVHYFNVLATRAGKRTEVISLPEGSSVRDLIVQLADRNSSEFRESVLNKGEISTYLRVFVNHRIIQAQELDRCLTEGDGVMLFPAVAGG